MQEAPAPDPPAPRGQAAAGAPEIARLAGVSVATVYMALRGEPTVARATAARVRALAQQHNYRPRASARALARGRTQAVAAVFAYAQQVDLLFARYGAFLQRLSAVTTDEGYHLNITAWDTGADDSARLPRLFEEEGVDGLMVLQHPGPRLTRRLQELGRPFVVVDAPPGRFPLTVKVDECRAAEQAVEHLVGLGHRRIAYTSLSHLHGEVELPASPRVAEFQRGYVRAMGAASLPVLPGWDEALQLEPQLARLLSLPAPPTALITYDDVQGAAAIGGLRRRGLRVPEDISVVGLHDCGQAARLASGTGGLLPDLTARANQQGEMAEAAFRLLLRHLDDPSRPAEEAVVLAPRFEVRDSTGPRGAG